MKAVTRWKVASRCMAVFCALLAVASTTALAQTPLGTAFTYQGNLELSGNPVNGTADFQFKLFGALAGGTQIGSTQPINNVTVVEGGFTVQLDFGAGAFNGDKRFLEILVRSPAGGGSFVTLTPRQELTAAPYALKVPGVDGNSLDASDGSPTNALSVDAIGNVGIGTTTPAAQLHVLAANPVIVLQDTASPSNQAGFISFRNNTPAETAWLGFGTIGSPHLGLSNVRSGGNIELYPGTGGSIKLWPTSGAFTVAANGKVGIGTTTPSRPLHVMADQPSLALEDPGSPSTQTGYVSFLTSTTETAWAGFGTAGSPHFSVVNARSGGDIVLSPGVGGVVSVPVLEITGADLAEKFPTSERIAPGMVVAIDPENHGQICVSRGTYNRGVAGVVSGANGFSVGAVLGNLPGHEDAPPIALSGRVYVWCDASNGAIEPTDLLTTSDTPGHAMKATDRERSTGAILGKAMTGLAEGRGLVLVLINLQ